MNNLTGALYDHLAADATLTALLSTYGGLPAIFTARIPEDVTYPCVVSIGNDTDDPNDCKNRLGRDVRRSVRVIDLETGSAADLEAAAERIYELLHRCLLTIADNDVYAADAEGPRLVGSDPDLQVREVEVRLMTLATI